MRNLRPCVEFPRTRLAGQEWEFESGKGLQERQERPQANHPPPPLLSAASFLTDQALIMKVGHLENVTIPSICYKLFLLLKCVVAGFVVAGVVGDWKRSIALLLPPLAVVQA